MVFAVAGLHERARFRSPALTTSLDDLTGSRHRDRSRSGPRRPHFDRWYSGRAGGWPRCPVKSLAHMLQSRTDSLGPAGFLFLALTRLGAGWRKAVRPRKPVKNWRKASFFDEERRAERRASGRSGYRSILARVLLGNTARAGGCRTPCQRPTTAALPGANEHMWMSRRCRSIPTAASRSLRTLEGGLDHAGGPARGRATVLGVTDRDLGYWATRRRARHSRRQESREQVGN
jgi:hypothetical protein